MTTDPPMDSEDSSSSPAPGLLAMASQYESVSFSSQRHHQSVFSPPTNVPLMVSPPITHSVPLFSLPCCTRLDTLIIPSKTHLWFLILNNLLDLFPLCIPNTHEIPIFPFSKLVDSI